MYEVRKMCRLTPNTRYVAFEYQVVPMGVWHS